FVDIPLEIQLDELKGDKPEWKELYSLYEQFNFKSLYEKIPEEFREEKMETLDLEYSIASKNEFQEIIDHINKENKFCFKFLTEDENYIENNILGIGIKTKDSKTYYIDFKDWKNEFVQIFKPIFEDHKIEKIGHD